MATKTETPPEEAAKVTEKRRCLELNIKILHCLGFWPGTQEEPHNWLYYWRLLVPPVTLIRMVYGIAFHCINISLVWGNIIKIAEFTIAGFIHICVLVRSGAIFYYRVELEAMSDVLHDLHDGRMVFDDHMKDSLDKTQRRTQWWSKVLLVWVLSSSGVFLVLMVSQGMISRTIPFRLFFPYNIQPSPIFEITLLTTTLFSLFDMLIMGACDLTFIVLMMLTNEQFRLLQYKLRNIRKHVEAKIEKKRRHEKDPSSGLISVADSTDVPLRSPGENVTEEVAELEEESEEGKMGGDENVGELTLEGLPVDELRIRLEGQREEMVDAGHVSAPNDVDQEMEKYLRHCIKHHQALLRLVADMGRVYRYVLALLVFTSALGGFGTIYITTLAPQIDPAVFGILVLLAVDYIDLLVFCWFGHQISDECAGVREAVYDCDWFAASKNFKQSLRIMISRLNRPLHIKAAGLPLSMGTFRLICRSGYYSHTLLTKLFYGVKITDKRKDRQ